MKITNSTKLVSVLTAGIILAGCNQQTQENETQTALNLEDTDTKVAYAIGLSQGQAMARNLETLDGTDIKVNKDVLIQAFSDGVNDSAQMDATAVQSVMNDFRGKVNAAMQAKREKQQEEETKIAEENKVKGAAFLEENKVKENVVTLESGLQYKVITEGSGKSPSNTDRVKVHYKGTLIDGSQFDSSYDRGQPATFGVTQVIKGWTEALQLMKEGAKWQLFIPSDLAYGPTSRPKIPGNSVLVFDVELLEVVAAQEKAEEAIK